MSFLQAIEKNAEGNETLIVGMTHAILPPAGDNSQYGDYLVTGVFTGSGSTYNLNLQYQTSCSREVIFQGNYPFELPEWTTSANDIGQNIANQIPLLANKINEYSTRKREKDSKISFSSGDEDQLKIEPKKKILG